MMSLLFAIAIFLLSILLHIGIHRFLMYLGIRTVYTVMVFLFGLFFLGILIYKYPFIEDQSSFWTMRFPIASCSLYALFVCVYLLFFLSFFYDAESPSAQLLAILRRSGPLPYKKILSYFTNKSLFTSRLEHLKKNGLLYIHNDRYVLSINGKILAMFFQRYRSFLRWDLGG